MSLHERLRLRGMQFSYNQIAGQNAERLAGLSGAGGLPNELHYPGDFGVGQRTQLNHLARSDRGCGAGRSLTAHPDWAGVSRLWRASVRFRYVLWSIGFIVLG